MRRRPREPADPASSPRRTKAGQNVHALGLADAQGLNLTTTFYWDLNDATRAFARRFAKRMKNGAVPTMPQAGTYSGALHFLTGRPRSAATSGTAPRWSRG